MKIYVASSWRNKRQPDVVKELRELGHEVYDFHGEPTDDTSFHWSHIDGGWKTWDFKAYKKALQSPLAEKGFKADCDAMVWADACILLLPCGRSAHMEAGWFVGAGKPTVVLSLDKGTIDPELMLRMCDEMVATIPEAVKILEGLVVCTHGLRAGRALCGYGEGAPPSEWKRPHNWTPIEGLITCKECQKVLVSEGYDPEKLV